MKSHVRNTYICAIALGVSGLTYYLNQKNVSEAIGRLPASESACMQLVSNFLAKDSNDSIEYRLKIFFQELEKYGWSNERIEKEISNVYEQPFKKSVTFEKGEQYTTNAEDLLKKMQMNEPSSKILLELGYTITSGKLQPPRDYVLFYSKLYRLLTKSALENGVSEDEIIYPTFIFMKGTQVKFVRPGIDPIPPHAEGWFFDEGYQLDDYTFSLLLSSKKILLSPEMFEHDIGHVIDLIMRPKYHIAYKTFHEKKLQFFKDQIEDAAKAAKKYGPAISGKDLDVYFNEFLVVTDSKNYNKIKQLIPSLNIETPRSEKQILESYKNMNGDDLVATGKRYLKNRYTLFSNHGGGSRDTAHIRFTEESEFWSGINAASNGKYSFEKNQKIASETYSLLSDNLYRMIEPPAIFNRLEHLIAYKSGSAIPEKIINHLKIMAEEKNISVDELVDQAIAFSLSELEFRVQRDLVFKMSPEQIALDTSTLYEKDGWKKYKKTATYAYYSTYPKDSPQWVRGVQIANED